ncbi:hypothetical protein BASA81_004204 [Batrachochytrium salamandrivorans]|nr:hypothetical protein BASA81_004204 [Batrachochytrium salamandrivorans]
MHPMLSLYRRILRLHRQKLPAQKRALGDSYVKKEFRDHQTAKPEFVQSFFQEWTQYCDFISAQRDQTMLGKDIAPETLQTFSPEQKAMLEKLKRETWSSPKRS